MHAFPTELAMMACESLSRRDVARLSRASRACQAQYEPLLYCLYAMSKKDPQRSAVAVAWAVDKADAARPETCALAEATLAKVARFCQLRPGDVDHSHDRGRFCSSSRFYLSKCCVYDNQLRPFWVPMKGQLLHKAAQKGLDGIVAWLLQHGADIHAPLLGLRIGTFSHQPLVTALYVAVSANCVSTAVLLLAHGARLGLETTSSSDARQAVEAEADTEPNADANAEENTPNDIPTVVHLACALGYVTMTEQLLIHAKTNTKSNSKSNTQHPSGVDLTLLLCFYGKRCGKDVPAIAVALLRQGATFSEDALCAMIASSKWQSASELLASPTCNGQITADFAERALWRIMRAGQLELETAAAVKDIFQRLLAEGAHPDTGRHLWYLASRRGWGVVWELLPPFLEAGMVLRDDAEEANQNENKNKNKKRKQGGTPGEKNARGDGRDPVDDLLGKTSPYEEDQDEEDNAAKLSIVRLLLQYGAPIQGATRGDALDAYDGRPPDNGRHDRAAWAYRLTCVLLDHCRNTPQNQQGEDIKAFLSRYERAETRAKRQSVPLLKGL